MRSVPTMKALVVMAIGLMAGAAYGQVYPQSPPLLRYPVPRPLPAVPMQQAPSYLPPVQSQVTTYVPQTQVTWDQAAARQAPATWMQQPAPYPTYPVNTPSYPAHVPVMNATMPTWQPVSQPAPRPEPLPVPRQMERSPSDLPLFPELNRQPSIQQQTLGPQPLQQPIQHGMGGAYMAPGMGGAYMDPSCGSCKVDSCGSCGTNPCCCCLWFGGAYGLFMTRENHDWYLFSYDDANEAIQRTPTPDLNLAGGFGVHIGRYCSCCRQNAVEAVYWGLYPDKEVNITRASTVAGNLNGIHNWDQLSYNGNTCNVWVNNALVHAAWRESDFQNVEFNLLHLLGYYPQYGYECNRFRARWLAGFRYFYFHDEILFGADTVDGYFTGAAHELYYNVTTNNHLVGFQFGAVADYALTHCLGLNIGFKTGLFGNFVDHKSIISGSAGTAVINNGPNAGRRFYVDNTKDDIAFLAEMDLGLRWAVTCRWSVNVGYRVFGISGVALPTNQIYHDLRGIQDVETVDNSGALLLHGGYAGIEYNF